MALPPDMISCKLCIHGHFYQPPRADPFTGRIPEEPDAAPYANWNERITAECYAPNAEAGHFGHLSFNLGGTLARWMEEHAPDTYARIVSDEKKFWRTHGASNGLAQSVHHTILPLARRRDKISQVRWGLASFRHRFGHDTQGMWLPEMAVDLETLEVLAAAGVRFIILSAEQVRGDLNAGAGPYRVRLPSGRDIAVFVRDADLSNAVSFAMPQPEDVDGWLKERLYWRCKEQDLLLIATDGETFGHHHQQGMQVLHDIISGAGNRCYELTALGLYLRDHPPQAEVEVIENTSWSCPHGLARWVTGCECTPGDSRWKGALRRALDNLASSLDEVYIYEAQRHDLGVWSLRDNYITVVLGEADGPEFLARHDLDGLSKVEQDHLMWLLEAQFYRQRMYASCAFFFDDLDRHEPRYAIANAVRAIVLTRYATGEDLSSGFRRDLGVAVSGKTGRTGADILDVMLEKQRDYAAA